MPANTVFEFCPITEADQPFLAGLYASTREDEMRPTGWPPETIQAFLYSQFQAQHRYYQEHFSGASFNLVLVQGLRVGRLYLERRESEIRVIDIALLPEYRGRGMGSRLMQDVLEEARSKGCHVRIHVELNNPAMRLYLRLGFRKIDDHGVYHLMEWTPEALWRADQLKTAS